MKCPQFKALKDALSLTNRAYAIYDYLVYKKIHYAIPYAKEPGSCTALGNTKILVNEKGIPICPCGMAMRYHTKDKQGQRIYTCPIKRPTHKNGDYIYKTYREECTRNELCEPDSKLGPEVRVASNEDPLLSAKLFEPTFPQLFNLFKLVKRQSLLSDVSSFVFYD